MLSTSSQEAWTRRVQHHQMQTVGQLILQIHLNFAKPTKKKQLYKGDGRRCREVCALKSSMIGSSAKETKQFAFSFFAQKGLVYQHGSISNVQRCEEFKAARQACCLNQEQTRSSINNICKWKRSGTRKNTFQTPVRSFQASIPCLGPTMRSKKPFVYPKRKTLLPNIVHNQNKK